MDLSTIVSILPVSSDVINLALHSSFPDFEDAIQYFAALQDNTITGIVTRNPKDFLFSSLPIFSPTSVLNEHLL